MTGATVNSGQDDWRNRKTSACHVLVLKKARIKSEDGSKMCQKQ